MTKHLTFSRDTIKTCFFSRDTNDRKYTSIPPLVCAQGHIHERATSCYINPSLSQETDI